MNSIHFPPKMNGSVFFVSFRDISMTSCIFVINVGILEYWFYNLRLLLHYILRDPLDQISHNVNKLRYTYLWIFAFTDQQR